LTLYKRCRCTLEFRASDELADHFTLLPAEHALVVNRSGPNRLGFAILLKYFQWEGRFPMSPQEIPSAVVAHLAATLGVAMDRFPRYDLDGRMARYHKEQIRQWTGFRSDTTRDAEAIIAWVCTQRLSGNMTWQKSRFLR
jgi:hypothetical protein